MKYICTVISVTNINLARKFYESLFGLKVYQDYGRNITFTCGLALQQDFDWLIGIAKENIGKKSNNVEIVFEEDDFDGFIHKLKKNMKMVIQRFLNAGMTIEEISIKMDVSIIDLKKLLNY